MLRGKMLCGRRDFYLVAKRVNVGMHNAMIPDLGVLGGADPAPAPAERPPTVFYFEYYFWPGGMPPLARRLCAPTEVFCRLGIIR